VNSVVHAVTLHIARNPHLQIAQHCGASI